MKITKEEWEKMKGVHSDAMYVYGPDTHVDGSDLILAFSLKTIGIDIPEDWIDDWCPPEYKTGKVRASRY